MDDENSSGPSSLESNLDEDPAFLIVDNVNSVDENVSVDKNDNVDIVEVISVGKTYDHFTQCCNRI
jgi:hypothetical protein